MAGKRRGFLLGHVLQILFQILLIFNMVLFCKTYLNDPARGPSMELEPKILSCISLDCAWVDFEDAFMTVFMNIHRPWRNALRSY